MLKAIRGAITVDENSEASILSATEELLEQLVAKNALAFHDVLSITFTATNDLDAAYPAVAARRMGFTAAALMNCQELYVQGSLRLCVRACVLAEMANKPVSNIYLRGAKVLRPDLVGE